MIGGMVSSMADGMAGGIAGGMEGGMVGGTVDGIYITRTLPLPFGNRQKSTRRLALKQVTHRTTLFFPFSLTQTT